MTTPTTGLATKKLQATKESTSASSLVSSSSPSDIAQCALHHYHHELTTTSSKRDTTINHHGKPRVLDEWTVYAAIVAEDRTSSEIFVVSSATGSKCTTTGLDGWYLRDMHAEVLSKRGFQRALQLELLQMERTRPIGNNTDKYDPFRLLEEVICTEEEKDSTKQQSFIRLKSSIRLHMYISDSPCGDATIYKLQDETKNGGMKFTGSKLIIVNHDDGYSDGDDEAKNNQSNRNTILSTLRIPLRRHLRCCCSTNGDDGDAVTKVATAPPYRTIQLIREGAVQRLGSLRTKSARSNLAEHLRSTSMSCSDKLVRWAVLGLQGSRRHHLCQTGGDTDGTDDDDDDASTALNGIRLSSVVVSRDPAAASKACQQDALKRAIVDRVDRVALELQEQYLTSPRFPKEDKPSLEAVESFVKSLKHHPLSVHVVDEQFVYGKAYREAESGGRKCKTPSPSNTTKQKKKRKRGHCETKDDDQTTIPTISKNKDNKGNGAPRLSCCGFSLNYNYMDRTTEVVVSARGLKQGKKPKCNDDHIKLSSRLCRQKLKRMMTSEDGSQEAPAVKQWQEETDGFERIKDIVFQTSPLQGWIHSNCSAKLAGVAHSL